MTSGRPVATRTCVRLLGPCFKTGQLEPFRQWLKSAEHTAGMQLRHSNSPFCFVCFEGCHSRRKVSRCNRVVARAAWSSWWCCRRRRRRRCPGARVVSMDAIPPPHALAHVLLQLLPSPPLRLPLLQFRRRDRQWRCPFSVFVDNCWGDLELL